MSRRVFCFALGAAAIGTTLPLPVAERPADRILLQIAYGTGIPYGTLVGVPPLAGPWRTIAELDALDAKREMLTFEGYWRPNV